ncbi:phage portal protein [Aquamicrobium lusatiense]|uniref:phage portal protein n=1 Tax=Aquamicrobium lusatiense TaxID=89772 RepID=UPI002458D729|nr:phage portal protein [Aquamicrobium lusatiense]MDH4992071.1 phage portal protein [Aquamicrobium lusatiense]
MKLLRNMALKAASAVVRNLSIREPDGWYPESLRGDAGEIVTSNSVLGLSAVWACVNLLSGTIASLPLMVYRRDKNGERVEAREHPLYRVLHDSPNFDQTSLDFWEYTCAALELWGKP